MNGNVRKRNLCILIGMLAVCGAVLTIVVMLFFQLDNSLLPARTAEPTESWNGSATASAEASATRPAAPEQTPIPTDVIVVPATDGPVFFGISSSISVDCVDPRYVKNQVIDRLFYLGYTEADYTVTEEADRIQIRLRVELDREAFGTLYATMLQQIYDSTVEQHLENGSPVDQNGIDSDDRYSYLTMVFYQQ